MLAGEAPANLIALVRQYFGLEHDTWGKDAYGGAYPWLDRERRRLMPLYGFVEGDTLGVVVLAQEQRHRGRARAQAREAAALRVAPAAGRARRVRGQPLGANVTVASAGLQALDRIDVRFERPHPEEEEPTP